MLDDVAPLEEDEPTIVAERPFDRPSYRAVSPSTRPSSPSSPRNLTDRLRDSKTSLALARTLQPLAAGIRSPLFIPTIVYALSMVALTISGIAWYLSRTVPSDSSHRAVAVSLPSESPVPATPGPSASTQAAPPASEVGNKSPIDVMRLPVAPQSTAQPLQRGKPIVQPASQR